MGKRFNKFKRTKFGFWFIHTYLYARCAFYKMAKAEFEKRYNGSKSYCNSRKIIKDMLKSYCKYHVWFNEYFLFNFEKLSPKGRREFIADYDRIAYCDSFNIIENQKIFDNKDITYEKFKTFYKRDVLKISMENNDDALFSSFLEKHKKFISKPIAAFRGDGIQIHELSENQTPLQLLNELKDFYKKDFVVEELIYQVSELRNLHPSSVNTIRVPTIRMDNRVVVFHPFMRVGKGNSVVDNAGHGGIMCAIDAETGIVIAIADEDGNRYYEHPDTKIQLLGFKIPKWDEAKKFVTELANVVPDNRYTGWDITLTENGWVMIEGNQRGQFGGIQITRQKGVFHELNALLQELKIKPLWIHK